jgi:hypothetical protein
MSRGGDLGDVLDRLVLSTPQQRVLRGLVLLAALVFLGVVVVVSGEGHPVLTTLGVLLAVLAAVMPETNAPLALQLFLGLWWLVATPVRLDGWTLVAAAAFTAVHVATTLAATAPPGTDLDPALQRRWWGRTAACLAGAVAVWLVASVSPSHAPSPLVLAAAMVLVGGWCVVVALRLARSHTAGGAGAN